MESQGLLLRKLQSLAARAPPEAVAVAVAAADADGVVESGTLDRLGVMTEKALILAALLPVAAAAALLPVAAAAASVESSPSCQLEVSGAAYAATYGRLAVGCCLCWRRCCWCCLCWREFGVRREVIAKTGHALGLTSCPCVVAQMVLAWEAHPWAHPVHQTALPLPDRSGAQGVLLVLVWEGPGWGYLMRSMALLLLCCRGAQGAVLVLVWEAPLLGLAQRAIGNGGRSLWSLQGPKQRCMMQKGVQRVEREGRRAA